MKLKRIFQPIALVATVLLTLTACGDDDDDSFLSGPYSDFVNVTSNSTSGVVFETYARDTDVEIELFSPDYQLVDDTKYPVGSRAFITYNVTSLISTPGPEYMPIQLLDIRQAYTPELERVPADQCSAGTNRLFVTGTPYRTGNYINLVVSAPTVADRTFKVQLDESTLETGRLKIYLSSTVTGDEDTEKSDIYPVSFDMDQLWDNPTVTQIDMIVCTGTDGSTTTYSVRKY